MGRSPTIQDGGRRGLPYAQAGSRMPTHDSLLSEPRRPMDHSHPTPSKPGGTDTAIDPICGMTVSKSSPIRAERDGETYYFCCEHCRQKFLAQASPGGQQHGL